MTSQTKTKSKKRKFDNFWFKLTVVCVTGVVGIFFIVYSATLRSFNDDSEALGQISDLNQSNGPGVEIGDDFKSPLEERRFMKINQLAKSPNELGMVPIIMYHQIDEPESEWVRTPDNFRRDLERFYELGYSLVSLQSYLAGHIELPAGVSPLIITFDDGSAGQFRYITKRYIDDNGARLPMEVLIPDPDSAVGILLDFSKEYPEFGHAATFFLNFPAPFGIPIEVDRKLNFLLSHGMELGNHTYNHKNLGNCCKNVIEAELGEQSRAIEQITGVKPLSLALPYGVYPRCDDCKKYLMTGEYQGHVYENRAVLLVGAEPALSPYHLHLDKSVLPRIRGSEEELSKWLKYLDDSNTRYISDGNSEVITVTKSERLYIDEAFSETYDIMP